MKHLINKIKTKIIDFFRYCASLIYSNKVLKRSIKYIVTKETDYDILERYIDLHKYSKIHVSIRKFYKVESNSNLMYNILIDNDSSFDIEQSQLLEIIKNSILKKTATTSIDFEEKAFERDFINKCINQFDEISIIFTENLFVYSKYKLNIKNNMTEFSFCNENYSELSQIILNSKKKISLKILTRDFEETLDKNYFLENLLGKAESISIRHYYCCNIKKSYIKILNNIIHNNIKILKIKDYIFLENILIKTICENKNLEFLKIESSNLGSYKRINKIIENSNLKAIHLFCKNINNWKIKYKYLDSIEHILKNIIYLKKDFKIYIVCDPNNEILKNKNFKIIKDPKKNIYCVEHLYIPRNLTFFSSNYDTILLFI